AAESVDAVVLGVTRGGGQPLESFPDCPTVETLTSRELRPYAFFRGSAWRYDAPTDSVTPRPRRGGRGARQTIVKVLPPAGVTEPADAARRRENATDPRRLGSYLSDRPFPRSPAFELRDAARWRWPGPEEDGRDRMLVLVPFLARGGAEHTLFETLAALRDRWRIAFLTLAPHTAEKGDRRSDFQAIWPHLYCLGDLVHPAAMPGMIRALIDAWRPSVIYNANGTTLFYDFAPGLGRPGIRVVDHLYDHRVGYIERFRRADLRPHIGAVVAENRRIAEALTGLEAPWPEERAPVV
ncbi:MAG: hypothetical protein AAF725_25690, partial [Acidobacteriota bacterium]